MGTPYVVSDLVTKQFVAGYEQSLKSRSRAGRARARQPRHRLHEVAAERRQRGRRPQVGDAKTIKISGEADVKRVIADLEKISEKASALNVPGASGRIPQKLTPQQKAAAEAAIKNLTVDVYTGVDDSILRRLTVKADLRTPPRRSTPASCWTSRSRRWVRSRRSPPPPTRSRSQSC